MANLTDIPDELLTAIFHHVESLGDWPYGTQSSELRTVSLVCRRFRARVLPVMWYKVEIKDPWIAERLLRALEENSEVGKHVRLVAVEGDWRGEGDEEDAKALAEAFRRMPLLEELRVYGLEEQMVAALCKLPPHTNPLLTRLSISSRTDQKDLSTFFSSPFCASVRALNFFPTDNVEARQAKLAPRWQKLLRATSSPTEIQPASLAGFLKHCGKSTVPEAMMQHLDMLQITLRWSMSPWIITAFPDVHLARRCGVPVLITVPQRLPEEQLPFLIEDPSLRHLSLDPYTFWTTEWQSRSLSLLSASIPLSSLETLYLPRPEYLHRMEPPTETVRQLQEELLNACQAKGIEVVQGEAQDVTGVDAVFFKWAREQKGRKEVKA